MINTDKQTQTVYTEQQIIAIIDEILEHSDCVMDAITNENTNFDGAELFNTVKNYIPKTKPSYIFAPEELEALLQKERRRAAEKTWEAAIDVVLDSSIDVSIYSIFKPNTKEQYLNKHYQLSQLPKQ